MHALYNRIWKFQKYVSAISVKYDKLNIGYISGFKYIYTYKFIYIYININGLDISTWNIQLLLIAIALLDLDNELTMSLCTAVSIRWVIHSYPTYYPIKFKLLINLCKDLSEYRYRTCLFYINRCRHTKVNKHSRKVVFRFVDLFGPRAKPTAAVGACGINEAA